MKCVYSMCTSKGILHAYICMLLCLCMFLQYRVPFLSVIDKISLLFFFFHNARGPEANPEHSSLPHLALLFLLRLFMVEQRRLRGSAANPSFNCGINKARQMVFRESTIKIIIGSLT